MSDFQPRQYGKFLLLERVARGGMAELFRAKIIGSKGFEKLVAIKKILPHLADQEEFVAAFIDEARLAAFLQHQNIVQIFDFGEMAGSYFISMEYLSGLPLRTAMNTAGKKNLPFDLGLALHIVKEICSGLAYAHDLKDFSGAPLNIIHRDIGPQNIFITFDGQVKIIDFGIARAASHNSATTLGSLKGKLAYMSPEQASGQQIDLRADIFSVGIILYELVTGCHLYSGDPKQVLAQAAGAKFTAAREAKPGLPASLYDILDKALARDAADRYQSAEALRSDLEKCGHDIKKARSKDLARFMNNLFTQEARHEQDALRAAAAAELPHPDEAAEAAAAMGQDETVFMVVPKPKRSPWRLVLLGGLLIAAATNALWVPEYREPIEQFIVSRLEQSGTVSSPAQVEVDPHTRARQFFADLIEASRKNNAGRRLTPEDLQMLDTQAAFLIARFPEEAFDLLRKTAERYPQTGLVHFHIGRLYTFRQQPEKAIASYRRATELDQQMVEAFFNLGYLYASMKEYDAAEEMYKKVVALAPPYTDEALFNLAVIEKKRGKRELSLQHAREALQNNPANQQAAKLLERLEGLNTPTDVRSQ